MAALTLTSPAFANGAEMPSTFTCQGSDVSPRLEWRGAPPGTKAFALVVDDPDAPDPNAPKMTWVHWVLYDLPPDTQWLVEGAGLSVASARSGTNDWKRTGYSGPCPPIGRHRYFFKLYALDTLLGDQGKPTKVELEALLEGHVLAKAELMGTYEKKKTGPPKDMGVSKP